MLILPLITLLAPVVGSMGAVGYSWGKDIKHWSAVRKEEKRIEGFESIDEYLKEALDNVEAKMKICNIEPDKSLLLSVSVYLKLALDGKDYSDEEKHKAFEIYLAIMNKDFDSAHQIEESMKDSDLYHDQAYVVSHMDEFDEFKTDDNSPQHEETTSTEEVPESTSGSENCFDVFNEEETTSVESEPVAETTAPEPNEYVENLVESEKPDGSMVIEKVHRSDRRRSKKKR